MAKNKNNKLTSNEMKEELSSSIFDGFEDDNQIDDNIDIFEKKSSKSFSKKKTSLDNDNDSSISKDNTIKTKRQALKEYKKGNKTPKLSRKERKQLQGDPSLPPEDKKTWKQRMRTLGILTFLGVFTGSGLGVWYFNTMLRSNVDYSNLVASDYIDAYSDVFNRSLNIAEPQNSTSWVQEAQANGITPLSLNPVDNFLLAEYNANQAQTFTAIGNGLVSTIAKQPIYSAKKYDGNKYSFESVSSGIVTVASCDVYNKKTNKIEQYSSNGGSGENTKWKYNSDISPEEYQSVVGTLPSDIQPYIISSKTVLSSSEVTEDEETGFYTFTLVLHNIYSVINYAKQVKKTGGLSAYPEFSSIQQEITIDSNWNLIEINVREEYSAVAMGMKVGIVGTLDTFFKFNIDVTLPV